MVEETVQAYAAGLEGKIVIAATNKVGVPQVNCLEALTREIPRALVFRAFNHLGWENFASPTFHDVQAELFFCGADGPARQQVEKLIDQIGIRPIYIGGLDRPTCSTP